MSEDTKDQKIEYEKSKQLDNENLTPENALEIISPAVRALQQNWLNNALNLANTMKNGSRISPGMFEDIKSAREQFEELERARLILNNLSKEQEKVEK